jgi:ketosteroid isomerase-like protein
MSQENVEVVRALFEAWNAGDMDAIREIHDPDVILQTVEDWPEPGPHVGREAVTRLMEQLRDTWDADTGVFTVRDGRIRRYEFFWNHADALEAARLSE